MAQYRKMHASPLLRILAVVPLTLVAWAVLAMAIVVLIIASLFIPFIVLFGEWKVKIGK